MAAAARPVAAAGAAGAALLLVVALLVEHQVQCCAAAVAAAAAAAADAAAATGADKVERDPQPYCEEVRDRPMVRDVNSLYQGNYGFPGMSFVTLAGSAVHGMKDVEVFYNTFSPGTQTPIHTHKQEEVLVILRGSGTVNVLEDGKTEPTAHPVKKNTTATVPPDARHQIVNSGSEDLHIVAAIGKPPMSIKIFPSWTADDADATPVTEVPWNTCVPRSSADVGSGDKGEGEGRNEEDASKPLSGAEGHEEL